MLIPALASDTAPKNSSPTLLHRLDCIPLLKFVVYSQVLVDSSWTEKSRVRVRVNVIRAATDMLGDRRFIPNAMRIA